MPDKSDVIIIIIYTQGQIVQIHLTRKMFNRDVAWNYGNNGKLLLQYNRLNKSQIKFLFVYNKSQI